MVTLLLGRVDRIYEDLAQRCQRAGVGVRWFTSAVGAGQWEGQGKGRTLDWRPL